MRTERGGERDVVEMGAVERRDVGAWWRPPSMIAAAGERGALRRGGGLSHDLSTLSITASKSAQLLPQPDAEPVQAVKTTRHCSWCGPGQTSMPMGRSGYGGSMARPRCASSSRLAVARQAPRRFSTALASL